MDEVSPEPAVESIVPQKKKSRKLLLAAICGIILIAAGSYLSWYKFIRPSDPFPKDIKSVSFPLYYPGTLPNGFAIDNQSFEKSVNVVSYTVTYEGTKKLAFTIQPRPESFDLENFQSGGRKLKSSIGDAYAGAVDGKTVVSIPTDDSWMLIGIPSSLKTSQLQIILDNIKAVR